VSWSLQLRNGDLTIGGATLGQTTGKAKLVQDLRCALLERMGSDPLHPWFGSLLDGGRLNGQEQPSVIATDDWSRATLAVEAEIRRVAEQYQRSQILRLENDRLTYGKPTLSPDELLMSVGDIDFFQSQDALLVPVTLITANDDELLLNVPLGETPVTT